jgi:glycosyltransferase involved in cell wall biosynthesis
MTFLFYVPQMAAYGGMERHICLLALLLAQHRHSVAMMTTSNSLNPAARAELADAGIEMRELPVARGKASRATKLAWLLLNTLRMRSRSWDVIYTNGQSGLARIVWLAANRRTRIVHHHHTAGDPDEQKTWNPTFRRVLAAAPELVACSQSTKSHLEAALGRRDIVFLPYLTPEMIPASTVRESRYASNSVLHFGFTGRLVPTKGIDTICELSRHPDLNGVRWHIHGSGEVYPAKYFANFPNIEYHGPYSGAAESAQILQRLDAIALFSQHNEGMPLSLIEAMAAGLPWVATDRGGTRELAVASRNCEVIPVDATFHEIKNRTLALIARIRTGQTSSADQRRVYDEYFSFRSSTRRWLEFLVSEIRA